MDAATLSALGLFLAILVQTALLAHWLGRLGQHVRSMQDDMTELRGVVIPRSEALLRFDELEHKIEDTHGWCRRLEKMIERLDQEVHSDAGRAAEK